MPVWKMISRWWCDRKRKRDRFTIRGLEFADCCWRDLEAGRETIVWDKKTKSHYRINPGTREVIPLPHLSRILRRV